MSLSIDMLLLHSLSEWLHENYIHLAYKVLVNVFRLLWLYLCADDDNFCSEVLNVPCWCRFDVLTYLIQHIATPADQVPFPFL